MSHSRVEKGLCGYAVVKFEFDPLKSLGFKRVNDITTQRQVRNFNAIFGVNAMSHELPDPSDLDLSLDLEKREFSTNLYFDHGEEELRVIRGEGEFEMTPYSDGSCYVRAYVVVDVETKKIIPEEVIHYPKIKELEKALASHISDFYSEEVKVMAEGLRIQTEADWSLRRYKEDR